MSQGFSFNGAGAYARVAPHADYDLGASAEGMTIEFWLRPDHVGQGDYYHPLVCWQNEGSSTQGLLLMAQNYGAAPILFLNYAEGGSTIINTDNLFTGRQGQWIHLACTYDRPTGLVRVYCDGAKVTEQAGTANRTLKTAYTLMLGKWPGTSKTFQGLLDEVTMYKRPLTAAEISAIYTAGAAGKVILPANQPPSVFAGADLTLGFPTNTVTLAGVVSDDGLPLTNTLTLTWSCLSGPATALFSSTNTPATTVTFPATGVYTLQLAASDGQYTTNDTLAVTVNPDLSAPPQVALLSPLDGSSLTAPTVITGTVSSDVLQSWTLQYRPKIAGEDGEDSALTDTNWLALATGANNVTEGPLGTFDPTLMLNGIYELRLVAANTQGVSGISDVISLLVEKNLKIGHFTVSFNDLTVPVAGLPIQIIRTYDSRAAQAGVAGDFGAGWSLDVKNVRLQKNRYLGKNWVETTTGGLWPSYALDPVKPRIVTITLIRLTVAK